MSLGSPTPPPSPPPRRTNWAAVSAIAACGGVLVAFLAYAIPHSPAPSPAPATSSAPPRQVGPGPASSQQSPVGGSGTGVPSAGPPSACSGINAAINEYKSTVGPSWYSKEETAARTREEIDTAITQSGGDPTPIMESLTMDFQNLYADAQDQAASAYNTVVAQTDSDIRLFRSQCGIS